MAGPYRASFRPSRVTPKNTAARRARLEAELGVAYQEFHAMVAAISEQGWSESSRNPAWTNGQLVFHVVLGFILVLPLARLLIVFGHLPRVCGRAFAGLLNFVTPLFHRINALGPQAAARIMGRAGVVRRFELVHAAVVRRLSKVSDQQWDLTMPYPTRWDPRFRQDMQLEDLFMYPILHLRHHRGQLRATSGEP